MRIGVVSDTHGAEDAIRMAIKQMGQIDTLIHAGDHYEDAMVIARELPIRVLAVTGNCDWPEPGKSELEVDLDGNKALITHGNRYSVKTGNQKIIDRMREGHFNLVIFGHTHVPEVLSLPDGYLLNPGSLAHPRNDFPKTFGIVEMEGASIKAYIQELKW